MDNSSQSATDINIESLRLISSENQVVNLVDFLIEISIYEDLFSNVMHGHIILSDSRGLIDKLPIIGDEYLHVQLTTPTFEQSIKKMFRVFRLDDREIIRDSNTQIFTLHFASVELFYDVSLPLSLPFSGKIHDVVEEIFLNFISANRDYDISSTNDIISETDKDTPLLFLNETENRVKYISPGWTPFKNINWLASKSKPKNETAASYIFWESNKAFYFGSIEYLMKEGQKKSIGVYTPTVSGVYTDQGVLDHNREKFIISDMRIEENVDQIKNLSNGYLASTLTEVDIFNKIHETIAYDYIEEYENQFHTGGDGIRAIPLFSKEGIRNPGYFQKFQVKNQKLYNNFDDNIDVLTRDVILNRNSSLLETTNMKMSTTIPGRTDIEVGNMITINYPAMGSLDSKSDNKLDKLYSGNYLITAINHRINRINHIMAIEAIKDSLFQGE